MDSVSNLAPNFSILVLLVLGVVVAAITARFPYQSASEPTLRAQGPASARFFPATLER